MFAIVVGIGAALIFILAFYGYRRTGSPSALISGTIGTALIVLGMAITLAGQPSWMTALPCFIVAFAFAGRGFASRRKKAPAASLILLIATIALVTGLLSLVVPR